MGTEDKTTLLNRIEAFVQSHIHNASVHNKQVSFLPVLVKLYIAAVCLQAYAELKAYASTDAYHNASGSEKELVNRLLNFMQEDAKLQVAAATLTIESALQETAPVVNNDKPIPLTW